MRRGVVSVVAALLSVGVVSIGIAFAKGKDPKPTIVRAGNLELEINGDITPRALPRHELAPMGIWGSGRLGTLDGSHPPALEEAVFDADKDAFVSVRGLPVCRLGQLEARATKAAESACGSSVLGRGSASVEVAFPEQKPIESTGPLVLFNGGERNGVVTVFAHAYVNVPAPTAVVSTVEIRRVSKGSLGLHLVVRIPKIAGGAGSPVAARFSMRREYAYKGKRLSVLSGRCPDGRMLGRGTFTYSDGTSLSGAILRPCTARD
ncbi:MAG TPA: hypothetical protein VFN92_13630 [Solirubrobacterales bacterium]|nr:hypothetical protein [Solirubrobacterales bacterium]